VEDRLPDLEFFLTNVEWVDDKVHFTSQAIFSVDLPFEGKVVRSGISLVTNINTPCRGQPSIPL